MKVWNGSEISSIALETDGTVTVVYPDGRIEVWGFWKGQWIKEKDNG